MDMIPENFVFYIHLWSELRKCYPSLMKQMSAARAEALRKLLELSYTEVAEGINRLAGTNYGNVDTHRWFRDKSRRPTVTLVLYLRAVLKARWHSRIARRAAPAKTGADLRTRTQHLLDHADQGILERFEKRLRLCELDHEARQFMQDA